MSRYNDLYEIFAVFRTTPNDAHANADVVQFFTSTKPQIIDRVNLDGLKDLLAQPGVVRVIVADKGDVSLDEKISQHSNRHKGLNKCLLSLCKN